MACLTAYQLACGHVQLVKTQNYKLELYKEHGVYFVIGRLYEIGGPFIFYEGCFYLVKDARKEFTKQHKLAKRITNNV